MNVQELGKTSNSKKSILIIDDDEQFRQYLNLVLDDAGYRVMTCEDGVTGIRMFNKEQPDLLLVDLFMPNKDGNEVIMDIRSSDHITPIIAMSGGMTSQHSDNELQSEMGANLCLSKPFNRDELLANIDSLI